MLAVFIFELLICFEGQKREKEREKERKEIWRMVRIVRVWRICGFADLRRWVFVEIFLLEFGLFAF